jgi:hypothetical protein
MGYTKEFQAILNRVPRVEDGRDIPESTRRNIAIQEWQQREFGDVYPPRDVVEASLENTPFIKRRFGAPRPPWCSKEERTEKLLNELMSDL